jgi:hypothetical protein
MNEWVFLMEPESARIHSRHSRDRGSIRNVRLAERSGQRGRSQVVGFIDRSRIAGRFAEPLPEDRRHPLPSPSSNGGATMLPSSPWLLASQSTGLKGPLIACPTLSSSLKDGDHDRHPGREQPDQAIRGSGSGQGRSNQALDGDGTPRIQPSSVRT